MTETQKTIEQWRLETFGVGRKSVLAARMNVEVAELLLAVSQLDNDAYMEMADVYIVLVCLAEQYGVDLQELVNTKMRINRQRKWHIQSGGVGQHI